jgi:hypothetical protein
MFDFFHALLVSRDRPCPEVLEIAQACMTCLEPDRVAGGLPALQLASFRRSVNAYLDVASRNVKENPKNFSTSRSSALGDVRACLACVKESWSGGECLPMLDDLLECLDEALSAETGSELEECGFEGNTAISALLTLVEQVLLFSFFVQ